MSDWVAVASALLAAVGLIFAGGQLMLGNQRAREDRRLSIDGVGVSWRSIETPVEAGSDGYAEWVYEITVDNPGPFPIDHVEICLVFPCQVQRVHYNRDRDDPTDRLPLGAPVLTGRSQRQWRRRLRIKFDGRPSLQETYAVVTFRDIERKPRENRWPREER